MVTHYAAYDEIVEFLADMEPMKLLHFKASERMQQRVDDLLDKNSEDGLSEAERNELEHYLVIDHIISLAKIRAEKNLRNQQAAAA